MKKLSLLLICICATSYASSNYELRLYEQILPSIFKIDTLKVYADKKAKEILINSEKIVLVKTCVEANVLIGSNFNLPLNCLDKPIFGTTYRSFKNNDNYFGAFYWRKGRPQIRFKLDVMKKQKLNLSQSLRKYAK